jgi:HCOMODA/2-hydroxy-3-carboxy-muconic semialdehyde decarboxylase
VSPLDQLIEELVTANRILARENVVDSFGHVSVRHPQHAERYLLSRSRAPDCIERDDIMEFTLDGSALDGRGRAPYLERFIHGAVYEARPDVMSVVHNHSESVIPFGVTGRKIRPIYHMGALIGHEVPVWDSHHQFGDTALLVENMEMGRDLAKAIGAGATVLMRGHGATVAGRNIRQAVYIAVYLEVNARLQKQAMDMGEIKFLTEGEADRVCARTGSYGINRAWENWCRRAGRPFVAEQAGQSLLGSPPLQQAPIPPPKGEGGERSEPGGG